MVARIGFDQAYWGAASREPDAAFHGLHIARRPIFAPPANRPFCEPLHTGSRRTYRYFWSWCERITKRRDKNMTAKTAAQMRLIMTMSAMIILASAIGVAPTVWAAL